MINGAIENRFQQLDWWFILALSLLIFWDDGVEQTWAVWGMVGWLYADWNRGVYWLLFKYSVFYSLAGNQLML